MVRDDISNVILAPSDLDQLFRILSSHHRRFILLLVKHGAVETKTDIVEWGEKSDTDLDETSLVHSHLPKLDDAGYIDWNRTTGDISKGTDFDEIESFLDFLDRYLYKLPGN
jgi:predicted transcriptional regulator